MKNSRKSFGVSRPDKTTKIWSHKCDRWRRVDLSIQKVQHETALIDFVEVDSPASRAGLQTGDIHNSLQRSPREVSPGLVYLDWRKLVRCPSGDQIFRDGKVTTTNVVSERLKTPLIAGLVQLGAAIRAVLPCRWFASSSDWRICSRNRQRLTYTSPGVSNRRLLQFAGGGFALDASMLSPQ